MDSLLITQGLNLLFYGMGTVFTFLTLLVGITGLMSIIVVKFAPDEPVEVAAGSNQIQPELVEPRIIKVIQAAINQHRGN
ncbi:MAG: OadG family protein [Porticoccaceae bacterium]|nr:OadG family protein [Porticoccaceae bacterium]